MAQNKTAYSNYWTNLKGHNEDHPTKRVLEMCWGKGKEQKTSSGWVSEGTAEQVKIQQIGFSPTAPWTTRPEWMLHE